MVLLQNRLNFQLALASLPTLQLFATPPPEVLALVQSILEEFYTDGIDQVVSAQLDDKGDIVGEFIDRVGARQVKRYTYRIQDSEVAFKLLNPNEVQNFGLESFKPLFGKGSKAGQKKSCRKGTLCGGTCISASKMCRKAPGSASKAKIQEAKQKLGGAIASPSKGLISQGFVDPSEDERNAPIASKEIFKMQNGETVEVHTPTAAISYSTQNTMWPIAIRNVDEFVLYGATAAARAVSLDQNQAMGLPQVTKKRLSPEELKKETEFRQDLIAATTPDGGVVVMYGRGKADREIAQKLGLAPATHFDFSDEFGRDLRESAKANIQNGSAKDFFVGRYENGKIRTISKQEIADIDEIKTLRQKQIAKGTEAQSIKYSREIFERNNIPPDVLGDEADISKAFGEEDALAQKIKATEDRYLGRKPTQIEDYKSYEKKAEAWAKETFGDFADGANGFTLAQTKAHDIAHPVTHELLNSNSKSISKRLGNLKQKNGKPSLLAEEAIVNVVEHLGRGDSIDASILNGLRLARVLSRSPSEGKAARKYVRSREFKNDLAAMAHELYRNDNYSLYMDHIRVSNRISGTVRNAGDDFANSASGG